eukprot:TRINITY_DN1062_c0_g1_i2.p1 TRINITY_DN1062_c0_g1~~TRINITY_DN1062_c0_g1_i2.p1  ORF type:complete len:210 (+),score=45.06 TRINITY_DN1062_c0_g1_i2:131-760(+)
MALSPKRVSRYVNCEVNRSPLKAFVDSGAQMTVMSVQCAERCGIMRLIDRKWAGTAVGVGTAKILGRIHAALIKIGDSHFYSSFTVLEDQNMDFLLGLDFLRKHQCSIDLKDKVLRIGAEAIPFLEENEIPKKDHQIPPSSNSPSDSNNNNVSDTKMRISPPPAQPKEKFPESVIESVMAITGQTREVVLEALVMTNGDADAAANLSFD